MAAIMFKMKCITNLHVGGGDVNYNLIDNEVERDMITGYPVIHASGVKGALREYFCNESVSAGEIDEIFGRGTQGQNETTPGKLKFMEAAMLAVPARASGGKRAYYLVSTQEALDNYAECLDVFWKKGKDKWMPKPDEVAGRSVEGISLSSSVRILDEEIHILSEKDFNKISLPVIARNKLENGISKNLWYEEVVPHQSVFYFTVLANNSKEDEALLNRFKDQVKDKVVQFGANASIGYGLCKITVAEE
ncbi:MAG: hypothetical protein K2N87_19570 [Eubacterium sp.]|nr:hypothetical protein [Eubacterium sp.]